MAADEPHEHEPAAQPPLPSLQELYRHLPAVGLMASWDSGGAFGEMGYLPPNAPVEHEKAGRRPWSRAGR